MKGSIFNVVNVLEQKGELDLNRFILGIIFIPFLGAAGIAIFYWWRLSENGISQNPEQWGQLGDFFGGLLNPTFAFFHCLLFVIRLLCNLFSLERSLNLTLFKNLNRSCLS